MKKLIYILLIVVLVSSCSLFKKTEEKEKPAATNNTTTETKKPSNEPIKKVKPFNTFSCKVSGSYKGIPMNATVRIAYDSIVWVSGSSFGIEGVRALCLTDSVFIINKLEKEYIACNYDRITKFVGMPLSYNFVQSLFFDTIRNATFNSPNFSGTIKKEITKVDKFYFPSTIEINAIFNQQKQNIKLKVKNHKVNTENSYPFSQPNGYKVRH